MSHRTLHTVEIVFLFHDLHYLRQSSAFFHVVASEGRTDRFPIIVRLRAGKGSSVLHGSCLNLRRVEET
jgi:hypothetical protein